MSKRTRLKISRSDKYSCGPVIVVKDALGKKLDKSKIDRNPLPYWANSMKREYGGSPLDTYDKAIKTVNTDRGENYGHPAVNFNRIAQLRQITRDCPDPRARVSLDEIVMKISRLIESPQHLDSWIDIAGYARAQVMIMQREGSYPDYPQNESSGD